ncbi:phytoene/squalene synthase family protein [Candidatus Avelusimicrobium aviculae]|uniref:phytoene/squalene synthase family protein n=1 Tax=Candidatus Avelusimicrobium aviculae TaxID=3416206 RepID=UPI003D0E3067
MKADANAYKKSSFGPAFLFLNKKQRQALAVYYAFCRLMDDIADEPNVPDPQGQLLFWREEIARVYEGNPQTPLGQSLTGLVKDFDIPSDRFLLLIDGMEADLQGRRYATFKDLEWYLYRVAVVVGLATLDILGLKGEKAQTLSLALGAAVQTTNIVRDVREDALAGRVYLPADMLAEEGLTFQDVLENTKQQQMAGVLAKMAGISRGLYSRAGDALAGCAWRVALPCRIMGWVYRANLAKIEKTGFIFQHKIKLTRMEKLTNIVYALFRNL